MIYTTDLDPRLGSIYSPLGEEEGPLKTLIPLPTKKSLITVCATEVGSFSLTSVTLCPPSFLTQLPLLILGVFYVLIQ